MHETRQLNFDIPSISVTAATSARDRLRRQARPKGSLGRLDELATVVAGIFDDCKPPPPKIKAIIMCGDHGVADELVSVFPQEVTKNISRAFLRGGTAYNVFCDQVGADQEVVDCGIIGDLPSSSRLLNKKIRPGTANIAEKAAMSLEEAIQSLDIGIERAVEAYKQGYRVLAIGEIGNSNTTVAAALMSALTGIPPLQTVGRGTGVPDWQRIHKINVVCKALAANNPKMHDPLDCLRTVGGFEIGAMTGAIIGGASQRMCVVVDGFISTVSALLAVRMSPRVRDYLVFSHLSSETGHRHLLDSMGAMPLLDLGLCLGEGTGAILAAAYVRLSCAILSDMATFEKLHTPDPYK